MKNSMLFFISVLYCFIGAPISAMLDAPDFAIEISEYHVPFNPDNAQEQPYWDRLLYLSTLENILGANPFTPEQQQVFQTEIDKNNKKSRYILGGIAIAAIAQVFGYLTFLELYDTPVSKIITSTIIPTVNILSIFIGLYGTGFQPNYIGVYDGLTLTLHEIVLEELNFLALFLIRKSFSHDSNDKKNLQHIISTIDVAKLREIYARQGNAKTEEVSSLTRALEEAVIYLKENRIVDNSFLVGEEIRLCLMEQKLNNMYEGSADLSLRH